MFTQLSPGQAESKLSENLHCKSHSFFTKWWDLLDLSKQKKLLDLGYIYPRGVRGGVALFFFEKVFFWNTLLLSNAAACLELLNLRRWVFAPMLLYSFQLLVSNGGAGQE